MRQSRTAAWGWAGVPESRNLSREVSKTARRGQIELLKFYRRPLQLYEAFFDDLVEAFAAWTCA